MRAISLIKWLEFPFSGTVFKSAICLGDVDNDGHQELFVGNDFGEVAVFKGRKRWETITGLGFITCMAVGTIFNNKRNSLVIVTADGWCSIFDGAHCENCTCYNKEESNLQGKKDDIDEIDGQMVSMVITGTSITKSNEPTSTTSQKCGLKRVYLQRIVANSKDVLLDDIDGDGNTELVLGLTDRVVRSYRWSPDDNNSDLVTTKPQTVGGAGGLLPDGTANSAAGKLVCLNKWECASQVGSVTLQRTGGAANGRPVLIVAQPGGTFMRIRCTEETVNERSDNSSENVIGSTVEYKILPLSGNHDENITTEILTDLKTLPVEEDNSVDISKESSSQSLPYAVATLDGTVMLVRDEMVIWSMTLGQITFVMNKLDVTGNGADELVITTWDGDTFIVDQLKNVVTFQLGNAVQTFTSGHYTVDEHTGPVTCFVYVTFNNKVLVYYDIPLDNMVCKKYKIPAELKERVRNATTLSNSGSPITDGITDQELVNYLLYSV